MCPADADFQYDEDGDGIGDACSLFLPERRELFDGFPALREAWTTSGTRWEIRSGDTIAPIEPLAATDPGLQRLDVLIDAPAFQLELGVISNHVWSAPDRFGIGLVADDGTIVARCQLVCTASCELFVEHSGRLLARYTIQEARPITRLLFRSVATFNMPANRTIGCGFSNITFFNLNVPASRERGHPAVWGSPNVQLAHVVAVTGD